MGLEEEEVRKSISEWIEHKTEADIRWGEDPEREYGTFEFTGEGRPDLLSRPDTNQGLTIVAELKDGGDSGGIYSSMVELHHYWSQYEYKGAEVLVDTKSLEVDVFLIATQYSKEGHLFNYDPSDSGLDGADREKGVRRTYKDSEPYKGKRKDGPDIRPQYAFARTEAIPPILRRYAWYEAEKQRGKKRSDIETGIGVLLSEAVDTSPDQDTFGEPAPKVQWYDGDGEEQWAPL